jgi:hypothetical protein
MPDVPPGSEQPQPKRRNSKTHTTDRDTTASAYPPQPQPPVKPSPQTDAYSLDEGLFDTRTKTSAVRLNKPQTTQAQRTPSTNAPIPLRSQQGPGLTRNSAHTTRSGTQPQTRAGRNVHWLVLVGLGMLAMLVLWVTGSWVLAWGRERYYDIRYGYPRTYQTDAVVGQGDSPTHPSHFIAINENREVIIIEFIAGDPSKTVVYAAPVYIAGQDGNLAPVTLEFRDVTGDGKVDMIVHIHLQSQDQYYVFVNAGNKFRPSNGSDKIRI